MKHLLEQQPSASAKNYYFQVRGTKLELPVSIIKGKESGPTVLITAGIHGSEYPGIEAAKRLIQEIDPNRLVGNLLIFPCINQCAFFERAAFINPADGKNLNRCFPGNPTGTESERLAYVLQTEVFYLADFYLDFHSGDLSEQLEAFVFVPGFGEESVLQKARQAASYLNLPFGVVSKSRTGAYNHASIIGVPSLLIERGGYGERYAKDIAGFVDDAKRIMTHLGMLEHSLLKKKELKLLTQICYFDSTLTGLWTPACKIGNVVKKGQLLGVTEDFFGNILGEYTAEQDGQILYQVASLPIVSGEVLIAYGY
ncbi:M14 family metallopeptidase [Enterococcus malodoratus]|uniref:M14 family metallopeptidase n=1 Tax=Enterococcus malodoratus TaxID=71451 RepID=UPI003FD58CF8